MLWQHPNWRFPPTFRSTRSILPGSTPIGIRAFPYVTFYQGFADQKYEGVDLREHPDWIEVAEDGSLKRTGFWESEDAKNMYTICPNSMV